MTIGELARCSGVAVKTVRFWSDEGLLPPTQRSSNGYRLYDEQARSRLELIRTLRDAGLGLEAIKKVLRNDLSLAAALRLQLLAVEAHVASLQRVAAALRGALRNGDPNESDLRRVYAVTQLTDDERRTMIEQFYERVSAGIDMDDVWRAKLSEVTAPTLPDDPTPDQLDAWIELAELVSDETFVESMRRNARQASEGQMDMQKLLAANQAAAHAAGEALAAGATPEAEAGQSVVESFVADIAEASGKPNDDRLRQAIYTRYTSQDARTLRYWQLMGIMTGKPRMPGSIEDWRFIGEAVRVHLAPEA
jgi:DNA-binding transcriptional MerR regulator